MPNTALILAFLLLSCVLSSCFQLSNSDCTKCTTPITSNPDTDPNTLEPGSISD